LDEVTTHLIAAGGKRLRPVLALASATVGGRSATQDDLLGAVAVELVHLASLYHDDVMDEATIRRNVESVNSRFGNLVAIVAGDFLLARSAEIAAGLGTEIAGLLAKTLGDLCQGQVMEVRSAFQVARSESDYTGAIAGKTASLMATSCRIGALTGGLPRDQVDAVTAFGRCFGMIFQVRDDVLDVIGSEAELGKPAGQDLAEGIYTLPVLLALADPTVGPELRPLLGQPLGPPEREKAKGIVQASDAVAAAVAVGRRYVDEAAVAAGALPDHLLSAGLARLADALLDGLPKA
jgi:heptaprenyl diphosphate synthase